MIRRAFGIGAGGERIVGQAGAGRRIDANERAVKASRGRRVVRRSWLRSAPPSAVGGFRAADAPGGSPHGFSGEPSCP